ncbi:WG repeat-containing protein [Raineya orbicola]|uniref:KWG Leptospira n=1 Tax=Raineya orbicola TaxID=2016530 RepID=A0A2N3I6T3_9BACT|nr:WG repeat-containing protein [Raineya orbicola]PKQ66042.1 hypothetical protein Rain11_2503 [Raineya orbicola]
MKKVVFISVLISINLLLEQKAFSQSSVELIPYRNKQMKWGYCDKNKKIIIPCEYDEVQLFRENIAFVRKGKKWGTIDTKGKVIINFQYSEVRYPFNNGVAVVIKNNQLSYIDTNGKETNKPSKYLSSNSNIENEFDKYCYNPENLIFNTNLAKVQKDELWALKDEKGKLVTPFKYYCIEDFKEGMAKVASKIEYISIVSNQGTETIKSCALYGFVDANGKEIIPCKYAYATDFKFGFTAVLTYPDTVNVDANTNYIDNAKKKTLIFDKKGNQLAEIDENSASFISNDSLLVLVKPGYRILAIYKLNGKALIPSNKYDLIEFLLFRMYDTEQLIIFPFQSSDKIFSLKK